MADTDIDRFIRHQKSKLASEKRELNDDEVYPKPARRQWAEPDKENFDVTDIEEPEERPETPAHQGYPVDNRRITKQQKELSVERKKEYNDYLKTHSNNRRKVRNESPTLKSIKMGVEDSGKKERLREERKNEYINNLQLGSPIEFNTTTTAQEFILPIGQFEEDRKRNAAKNKQQYRAELDQQLKDKENTIKKQFGIKSKKSNNEKKEREKQQKFKEDVFKKQLRVQGSPRKSVEKLEHPGSQLNTERRYPRVDYHARAFKDLYTPRKKHNFKTRDEFEEWQARQMEALNNIDRRQQDLRLKLDRDRTLHLLDKDVDIVSSEIDEAALEDRVRSPSPHLVPPLYDPNDADYLRQSNTSPERLLIGENLDLKQQRDKLRLERQQEYKDMMSQKRGNGRRNIIHNEDEGGWGIFGDRSVKDHQSVANQKADNENRVKNQRQPAAKSQQNKENVGNSGHFPADSSQEHRKKLAEERKKDYEEMKTTSPRLNRRNEKSQPASQSSPTKVVNRRMWKEDSELDFFSRNKTEPRRQQSDPFLEMIKVGGTPRHTPAEQNGYVPSQLQKSGNALPAVSPPNIRNANIDQERREEYNEILKSKTVPRSRKYIENDSDEFMSNKYDTTPRKPANKMEEFLKSGPVSPRKTSPPQNNAHDQISSNPNIDQERREEYNSLLKNSNKGQKKLYKEPSKDDFFDFGRIQRNNNVEKQPRERAPIDEQRKKDYNDNIRKNGKPKPRPFREKSSDDFLKYGGPQRRVNNNSNRMATSETFVAQEKNYQNKLQEARTPRRRTWREPSQDDFYIGNSKYQKAAKKIDSGSYLLA